MGLRGLEQGPRGWAQLGKKASIPSCPPGLTPLPASALPQESPVLH